MNLLIKCFDKQEIVDYLNNPENECEKFVVALYKDGYKRNEIYNEIAMNFTYDIQGNDNEIGLYINISLNNLFINILIDIFLENTELINRLKKEFEREGIEIDVEKFLRKI